MSPTFIMSSERSGSNLLREMLGMHADLAAPPPPHMWRHLTAALPQYGPLTVEQNRRQFVEAAVSMTQVPKSHLRWKYDLSSETVLNQLNVVTPTAVIAALYAEYARREEAEGWVCKENNLFDHAFQIRDQLPDAQFLYLCRDGRDVACSMKKVPTHDQHVFYIAGEWKGEQRTCIRVHQEFEQRGISHLVRYEDLIEDPERELRDICKFLGLEFQERMLYFHESEQAHKEAKKTEYWENLSKPVMSDNKGKFYDQLTRKEIRLIETVAAKELSLLGYPIVTNGEKETVGRLRRLWYRLENRAQRWFQDWDPEEEEGRKNRQQMLARVHDPPEPGMSFEKPISYTRKECKG